MSESDFVPANDVSSNWNDDSQGEWEEVSLLNEWEANHPLDNADEESFADWNSQQEYDFDTPDDWDDVDLLNDWEGTDFSSTENDGGSWDDGDGCCDEEEVPRTLTQRIQLGGSATKWKSREFEGIIHNISPVFGKKDLLGFVDGNDCAIVDVNKEQSTVFTFDWFPPLIDTPYAYGAISAAASLAKLYAVGAKPLTALNIMALPRRIGLDSVGDVMKGGSDKVVEAGAFVVGGHSIDDAEPKYGLATFGIAHPDEIIHNENAKPGDVLYLTKPLGTGILERALQAGLENDESLEAVIDVMMELNKHASDTMKKAGAHAAAAVSESGLIGHLHSILEDCNAAAQLHWDRIPLFDHVLDHCKNGLVSERAEHIIEWADSFVSIACEDDVAKKTRMGILCDPQTSGGLLIAIPSENATQFEEEYTSLSGRAPARIGEIVSGETGAIKLL